MTLILILGSGRSTLGSMAGELARGYKSWPANHLQQTAKASSAEKVLASLRNGFGMEANIPNFFSGDLLLEITCMLNLRGKAIAHVRYRAC